MIIFVDENRPQKCIVAYKEVQDVPLEDRIMTFENKNWLKNNSLTPKQMADAGFVYSGTGDLVYCYYCKIMIWNWNWHGKYSRDNDPWYEHAKHNLKCNYVIAKKGIKFILNVKYEEKCGIYDVRDDDLDILMNEIDSIKNISDLNIFEASFLREFLRYKLEKKCTSWEGERINEIILRFYNYNKNDMSLENILDGPPNIREFIKNLIYKTKDFIYNEERQEEKEKKIDKYIKYNDNSIVCGVCLKNRRNVVFYVCMHMVCGPCSLFYYKSYCPFCNERIQKSIFLEEEE
uniref:Baculoviral IAP repeat-containing protein n=1 Tax=Metapenaeus joyneri majanivirus TaxID=2984280 RepID=A0A9C7EYR8_9VIRU|nr:MAG: baculoviral IAP repeat-containing protein [Metapenaeus joyneri majanivirus]